MAKTPYGYRRRPRASLKNVPTSPSKRHKAWSTVTIRSEHYAMLRELCEYYRFTIGEVTMQLIEKEFNRVLALVEEEERQEEARHRETNRP
jgi:hypothetical protein